MSDNRKEFYYDKRVTKYYQRKGKVTQKDFDNYLKTLPNDEENFELAPFEDDDLEIDNASFEDINDLDDSQELVTADDSHVSRENDF